MAQRYDIGGELRLIEGHMKSPQGYLLAEAYPTKTGVLRYIRGGQVFDELRPPEEVEKVLPQIPLTPVISKHRRVGPQDSREFEGVHVGDVVLQDDGWVRTGVQIMAAKAIEDIEKNRRRQLSGGFVEVKFDATPGFWDPTSLTYKLDGQEPPEGFNEAKAVPFDGIQRDLVWDHSALVAMGRAGSHGSVRFDELSPEDGVEVRWDVLKQVDGLWFVFSESGKKLSKGYGSKAEAQKRLSQIEFFKNRDDEEDIMKVKITLDGVEYEVEEPIARAFQTELRGRNDSVSETERERDQLNGQIKALTEERDTWKGKAEALEQEKNQRNDSAEPAAVKERLAVLAIGQKAGVEYLKVDPISCDKSNEQIKRDAVKTRYDKLDIEKLSDAEVNGMFLVLQHAEPPRYDSILKVVEKEETSSRSDEDDEFEKAYNDMCKRMSEPAAPPALDRV